MFAEWHHSKASASSVLLYIVLFEVLLSFLHVCMEFLHLLVEILFDSSVNLPYKEVENILAV